MITERDREIINFIYDVGFLTMEQCAKIFFQGNYAYDLSRKRLNKIVEHDYIRKFRNSETNQLVFVPTESKVKRVSKHNILLIDYLAALKNLGAEIELLEIEKDFKGIVPDAFIIFKFNNYRYYQLVEIELRHDYVDVNRFIAVKDKILEQTNNTLPNIIIVQNTKKDYSENNETGMEIVQLDTSFSSLAKVFI